MMKAALLKEYGKFEYTSVPIPEISHSQVLVEVEYASICGSDQHIFTGEFHPRTPVPFVPGHEFAGRIAQTGSRVKNFRPGQRVAVDPIIWCGACPACQRGHYPACTSLKLLGIDLNGGFAEYVAVEENMLYSAEGIEARHAALVEVLSIGFHAARRAQLAQTDSVAIWGAGKIGQSILQAVRTITQKPVFLIDILPTRLAMAKKAYPEIQTIDSQQHDPVQYIKSATEGAGVDAVFEAVGHVHASRFAPQPVQAGIQALRGGGRLCVLSLSDVPAPVLMKELIWKEARIVSSRVSHGEFAESISQLAGQKLKPDALISEVLPLSKAQQAFEMLEKEPENYLKILLDPKA